MGRRHANPGDAASRKGWKTLISALLFADGPTTRWPEDTSSVFAPGTKLADAVALIRKAHAPIAHLFGSGIGFKLMLMESEILVLALDGFIHRGSRRCRFMIAFWSLGRRRRRLRAL
jgi:hypothetical protein